ncbi:MAG: hypothetical protein QM651_08035, partial [Rhodoblastus sp.]
AAAAVAIIASQVTSLRSLDDAARAASISMSALRDLNTAGAGVGIDASQMNQEMAAFAQKLREAQVAGGDLADFMEKNNIAIKDAHGNLLPVQQVFGKVAELVMSSNNEMDRLAALTKLGFSADMLRLIERQGDAVREFAASAKSAQDEVLQQGLRDGEALSAAWNSVWSDIKGAALSASVSVLGYIGDIAHQGAAKFEELGNRAAAAFHRMRGDAAAAAKASQAAFAAQRDEVEREAYQQVKGGKSPFGALDFNAIPRTPEKPRQTDAPTIKGLYDEDESGGGAKGKRGGDDAAAQARAALEQEIQTLRAGLERKKALWDEQAKLFTLSERERIAATKAATEDEYSAERALLLKELALEGQKSAQKQQINARLAQLEAKHDQDMLRLAGQNVQAIVKEWHKVVDAMANSLSSSITGMLTGQKKLVDGVRDMARAIIGEFVRMSVQTAANWAKGIASKVAMTVAGEAQLSAATTAGVATRQAAEASGEATGFAMKAASMAKSIMASAAETFAGVMAFLSPVMGPAAAGPASAAMATVASVAKFDVGAWSVDRDQFAMVHRSEMIMTAGQSEGMRNVIDLARGAFSGGGAAAPQVHAPVSMTINAVDARDVQRKVFGNGRAVAKELGRIARSGANLGVRGLSKV